MEGPLLSAELLAPVVRRALDVPDAWPSEWSCEPLDWQIVNPSTAGLYRVVGTAEVDRGPPRPWRVVLKILHLPDLTGTPVESGYIDRPEDWNYWKREVLARRSGIPDRFSWPLRPVRCWGTEDVDDTTAWLWLEGLDTSPRRVAWSLPELADAAYGWGAFAAQGVAIQADVQCQPWAARTWVRGWVASFGALGADHALAHEGCWRHPLVRERLPVSARAAFVRLMAAADPLLDRLDALPRTVAHHDTQWNNLFQEEAKEGRGTVAIDWGFFGTAPIGEDLGHHIGLNVFLGAVQPHDAEEARAHGHQGIPQWTGCLRLARKYRRRPLLGGGRLVPCRVCRSPSVTLRTYVRSSVRSSRGRMMRPRVRSLLLRRSWTPGARLSGT